MPGDDAQQDAQDGLLCGPGAGELCDLVRDAGELRNLWDDTAYAGVKGEMLRDLLEWLAGSVYWNAGYKRARAPDADALADGG